MRSRLHSGDPRLIAWSAHDALLARNPYLIPDLLTLASKLAALLSAQLQRCRPWSLTGSKRGARCHGLDTLIQMNVVVPADTLRALAEDYGNYAAVLLTRLPPDEAGPLCFELYRSAAGHSYALQYVSAVFLALHPLPGFAADLLASINVSAAVYVVPPNSERFGVGTGSSCGVSFGLQREDWPLIGEYSLSGKKSEGAMLVVAGSDPIYAQRSESFSYVGRNCGSLYLGPDERRRLIAEMLSESPDQIPWSISPELTIEYQSPEQMVTALLAFIADQQQMYRATAGELATRDLIEASDIIHSIPTLHLNLQDMRGEGGEPLQNTLQSIVSLPARVEWSISRF